LFLRIIKLKNIRNIANRFRNLIIRKMNITETIAKELTTGTELPNFKSGDNITVYYTIKEGDKQRTQFFKGDVIQRKGSGATETFTIRKISHSIGVERIFPINSPLIEKIEVNKKGKVRRARIYYLRELTGKKARIREAR
jgi:large subunit ribosomal protein L19